MAGTGAAAAQADDAASGHAGADWLNCGTRLIGRYCHRCGQSAHVHRSLASMAHDLLHGAFQFEGRIWRTMPALALHPGALTRRYIAGERARFVSPLALFLFTVFLLFATFETLGPGEFGQGMVDGWNSVDATTARQRAAVVNAIAATDRDRAALVAARRSTSDPDRRLARLRAAAARLAPPDGHAAAPATGEVRVHSRWPWLNAGLRRAQANPGLAIYRIEAAAYKYSWALIVLSTPLVALLFVWRRRFGLYDHATFVTYSISFMSLLAVALQLLGAAGVSDWVILAPLLLVPPVHMLAHLRGAYDLSVFGAAWRTLVLLAGALMALAAFVVGVIALEVT